MKASLDQLAKELASGVSRRKAFWHFVGGFGVIAALTGRKAYALGRPDSQHSCEDFCEAQAELFKRLCMRASELCNDGKCAEFTLLRIGFNGTIEPAVNINGSPFICVGQNP